MKLMVYSHDAFGLGNIRRMLAICQYLIQAVPNISILVISGSPALHSLRLPDGLDYIKLPCVGRNQSGELTVKFLDTEVQETIKLRSELILAATANFKPDLFLVDKKPDGLQGELKDTLAYLKANSPETKLVLLLRDILDRPDITIQQWQRCNYYQIVEWLYDQVWVIGTPTIFDVCQEYAFPKTVADKVRFCGYIDRQTTGSPRSLLRSGLGIQPNDSLVLVTPGGGGDGFHLVEAYLTGLAEVDIQHKLRTIKSLIVSGPEMPVSEREELSRLAANHPDVQLQEFTDNLISYMDAADLVVSMAGHNTISEILSLRKRAIVVPRVSPVEEQWIRADRMAKLGLFKVIHPQQLTSRGLMDAVLDELAAPNLPIPLLDMQALPRILNYLSSLLSDRQTMTCSFCSPNYVRGTMCLATADR
jgi:predicted glycosyltransferase